MPGTLCKPVKSFYLNVFPSWKGRQPVDFFMMENLLEARLGSAFPTNGSGPDEDVNVFLAGLLTRFLTGTHDQQVVFGAGSLLSPPDPRLSRRQRAQYYLANANCRLLCLGLFNRGDDLRRRRIPFGLTENESRERDLGVGGHCYRMAANLLSGRQLVATGLVEVLEKLAENFEDYVQVLTVLATRKLGLGAKLSSSQLAGLMDSSESYPMKTGPSPRAQTGSLDMDRFLDLMLQYGKNPGPELEKKLRHAARLVGADEDKIFSRS